MSEETIDYRKLAEALAEALEQRNLWIEGEEYRELVILRMRLSARVDSLTEELKAATARIAELEAAQRWIPVSERLPEADGYYWTMDFFKQEQKYKYRQKKWYDQSGMAVEFSATHVTHWMPLPKSPEVQE